MNTATRFLLLLVSTTPLLAGTLPEWLRGSWRLESGRARIEEHWTAADGGIMVGMGKSVSAKGKVSFEFLRIAEADGKLAYLAMPGGRPPTTFPLKSIDASRVVFENLQHDFPQRISYWRAGEKLCASTEGMVGGKVEREEWCFTRVAR